MSFNMFPHYQTLESGTEGKPGKANRSIPDRIVTYGIDKVIDTDKTVLDLGCNRGYFGICLSPYIGGYLGVEASYNDLVFGIKENTRQGLANLSFMNEKYSHKFDYGKFDIIICCAFHIYTGIPMDQFGKHLIDMLNPEGHLFLEGHPPGYHLPNIDFNEPEHYWNPLTGRLGKDLKVIEEKKVKDRELLRPFIHYQKCN
ncbi:hypothetical protein LCGC14_0388590 [marine sediment metagenome]|uniref:Methyltransferase domain-containing protein n=1 Tax=marine sediment metagenome TaxID=412755 RepID=A0A0F9TID2_9ZZZZ